MDCGQAHLSSSTTPGLIIAQSCLTSDEGRLRLPGRHSRQVGGEEKTVKGKEVTKEAKKARVRERKSGKCEAEGDRHRLGRKRWGSWKKKRRPCGRLHKSLHFAFPLCRIFPSNLHSYLAALAGTTKVFSTRPSGRLPATLSECLSAWTQVLSHPPQSSVRALGSTDSPVSSASLVT